MPAMVQPNLTAYFQHDHDHRVLFAQVLPKEVYEPCIPENTEMPNIFNQDWGKISILYKIKY